MVAHIYLSFPITFVLLLLVAAPGGAAEFLSEDFNAYADDGAVAAAGWQLVDQNTPAESATWTVTNPGGRGNPPTRDGTPSDGKFMVSDSDNAGGDNPTGSGMSHDLWSPSMDCSAGRTVWVHFDCTAQLNNNGRAVFDVDVSTDGGATWENVFRRVAPQRTADAPVATLENAGGFFGRLDLDISAQAAGQPDVVVRWRHFEPSDDWWIAIDNVVVDTVPGEQGGDLFLLGLEEFAAGIPGTWTVRSLAAPPNAGNDTWNTNDPCSRSAVAAGSVQEQGVNRLGDSFVILDSDCNPDPAQDEYLITPVVDCSAVAVVYLHWKSETVYASGATAEVLVSLDGGATFLPDPVFSYNAGAGADNGEEPFYADRAVKVPVAVGAPQVAFAFRYQGQDNWWWAVDDVMITAATEAAERFCEDVSFEVVLDGVTGAVTGTWIGLPSDQGYRVFRGDQQLGDDLPGEARSFTDESPPLGGTDVVYTIQVIAGGGVVAECAAAPIDTFACPQGLDCCTTDQEAGTVTLSWTTGANVVGTGLEIRRDGAVIDTLDLDAETYTDTSGPGVFTYEVAVIPVEQEGCPATLTCRARVAGPNYFFENFEGYATDEDVVAAGWQIVDENNPIEESTWTITNPGSRGRPPTFDGTASECQFMISDSDTQSGDNGAPGSGMSHDLWSPSIDLSEAVTVWLHFDVCAQLNNNGKALFEVDVSLNGGTSWAPLFLRAAPARVEKEVYGEVSLQNADGVFGRLHLDLTARAAGQADVRIRWRHFEPSWDWFIAIDNVLVDDRPVVGGTSVLLAEEGFTDGIPETWTVQSRLAEGTAPWSTTDACNRSLLNANGGVFPDAFDGRGLHRLDASFAIIDGACAQADQDEILATPVIDCSEATDVYLHLKSATVASSDSLQEILVSLDGGATYNEATPIFSYNGGGLFDPGEEPFYNEYLFEVPAAAGQSQVVVAFHYASGAAGELYWWAIDDVMVTGTGIETEPSFIRGDSNGTGGVDISDAVYILQYLFADGPTPSCMDAADSNDIGGVDISDGVYILQYLFANGPDIPQPHPDCGPDSTEDELACESYPLCP